MAKLSICFEILTIFAKTNQRNMGYTVCLPLGEEWKISTESFKDEYDNDVCQIEAVCGLKEVNVYVGSMPEDETAEDQAFSNYADMVGFDEDDPDDFEPVSKIRFNGKNAWTFEAYCEDECPMRLISLEPKQGMLCIICFKASDEEGLEDLHNLIEKKLRIKQ